jgi:hypothetical protein
MAEISEQIRSAAESYAQAKLAATVGQQDLAQVSKDWEMARQKLSKAEASAESLKKEEAAAGLVLLDRIVAEGALPSVPTV